MLSQLNAHVRQYMLVTFNYWNFTLTDGALNRHDIIRLGLPAFGAGSLFVGLFRIFSADDADLILAAESCSVITLGKCGTTSLNEAQSVVPLLFNW